MRPSRSLSGLSVRGVTVAVAAAEETRTLLVDVHFEAPSGAIVAVTGPSGSGKTSLLRALASLTPVATGTVTIDGESAHALSAPVFRRKVHYVFQRPRLGHQTVAEALLQPFGFGAAKDAEPPSAEVVAQHLDTVGLSAAVVGQAVSALSEGERQRVALVRSLLIEPRVLMLDEPTSALDKESRLKVEAAVVAYVQRTQAAVLLISHDEDQVERLSTALVDVTRFLPSVRAEKKGGGAR